MLWLPSKVIYIYNNYLLILYLLGGDYSKFDEIQPKMKASLKAAIEKKGSLETVISDLLEECTPTIFCPSEESYDKVQEDFEPVILEQDLLTERLQEISELILAEYPEEEIENQADKFSTKFTNKVASTIGELMHEIR